MRTFAGDGRPLDIDNGECPGTAFYGKAESGERVGGFTGLGNCDDQCVLSEDRVLVAEFRGDINRDRDMKKLLKKNFSHHSRVHRCAAGGDNNAGKPQEE